MSSQYEICFVHTVGTRRYVRCGVYGMSLQMAEKVLNKVQKSYKKSCFIRKHSNRDDLRGMRSYFSE